MISDLIAYIDGACEPKNPGGHGTWAYLVLQEGKEIARDCGYVPAGPAVSNNVMEYQALVQLLTRWHVKKPFMKVLSDSQLVVKQINGVWKARAGIYLADYQKAAELWTHTKGLVKIDWIRGVENLADKLTEEELNRHGIKRMVRR